MQLEKLKSVIIKTNPQDDRWNVILSDEEPIRLADVLLAIEEMEEEKYLECKIGVLNRWILRDDNLEHQPEETKQFLIDLLCS